MLDLENSVNWFIRDSQFFVTLPNNHLPSYTSNINFTSNIIAVFVENSEALDTWNYAGRLSQIINLPFGPNSTGSAVDNQRLWLRRKQLLIFPQLTPTYKILVQFPKWFTQVSITIWEYLEPQQ